MDGQHFQEIPIPQVGIHLPQSSQLSLLTRSSHCFLAYQAYFSAWGGCLVKTVLA